MVLVEEEEVEETFEVVVVHLLVVDLLGADTEEDLEVEVAVEDEEVEVTIHTIKSIDW